MVIKDNSAPCGHENRGYLFKYKGASIYKCGLCGLIFTDKYNTCTDPARAYENYYNNKTAGRFNFGIEHIVRLFRFWRAFKIFTVYPRSRSILDIGSGRGFTLYYLKKYYGYRRTAGTQISKNGYEFSRNKLGLEVYDKDLLEIEFDKNTFDMVTLWHVLEHVATPELYIDRIRDILTEEGELIIEVPNFDSWTRRIAGKYWLGLDLDYHIYFFTPETISRLLEKHRFKIKTIRTFSLEYSTFISAQSLVSRITKTDQVFFKRLLSDSSGRMPFGHLFLFVLIAPFCFLVNLVLYFSKKGEVIFIIAKKNAE